MVVYGKLLVLCPDFEAVWQMYKGQLGRPGLWPNENGLEWLRRWNDGRVMMMTETDIMWVVEAR